MSAKVLKTYFQTNFNTLTKYINDVSVDGNSIVPVIWSFKEALDSGSLRADEIEALLRSMLSVLFDISDHRRYVLIGR